MTKSDSDDVQLNASLDEDTDALQQQLAACCNARYTRSVIPALTGLLAATVVAVSTTEQGLDDFIEIFRDELHTKWRSKQVVN